MFTHNRINISDRVPIVLSAVTTIQSTPLLEAGTYDVFSDAACFVGVRKVSEAGSVQGPAVTTSNGYPIPANTSVELGIQSGEVISAVASSSANVKIFRVD